MTNTTWNPSDKSSTITLSAGNLNAKFSNAGAVHQGGVRGAHPQSAGKIYVEYTFNPNGGNANPGLGIGTGSAALNGWTFPGGGVGTNLLSQVGGAITIGTGGSTSLGDLANGDLACMALDLDNNLIWFRRGTTGNWNGSSSANPATQTGGLSITAGTYYPFAAFDNGIITDGVANFGDTSFSGTVPSGFTAGWPTVALTGPSTARKRRMIGIIT